MKRSPIRAFVDADGKRRVGIRITQLHERKKYKRACLERSHAEAIAEAAVPPEPPLMARLAHLPVNLLRLAVAFSAGDGVEEAAKRLGVSRVTVWRWTAELETAVRDALIAQGKRVPGRGREIFAPPACPLPTRRPAIASAGVCRVPRWLPMSGIN